MERSRQPSVFVAMPFGKKSFRKTRGIDHTKQSVGRNATVTVDFNEIWEQLIGPALVGAGCMPYRADDEPGAGDIRTDMFFELVTGEFVLADISILNANVFYELGVRHGVSPRGVLMIDGGWCNRPFDVAPDRTFAYKGSLFELSCDRDEAWTGSIRQEIHKLAERLKRAIANDRRTTSSPVYKELSGLIPVNWNHIQNTKARYFGDQFHEWHARVRKAKRLSYVGDILTLSRDAPNRIFEWEIRLDAARALFDLGRFDRARELLRAMVSENPECPETHYALAKTLHGLAEKARDRAKEALERATKTNDPEEVSKQNARASKYKTMAVQYNISVESEIEEAIRRGGNDPEAYRLLGRIYKYRWRNRWEHGGDVEECKRLAREHWQIAEKALTYYQDAQTRDLSLFQAGINVLSLIWVRSYLKVSNVNQHEIAPDLVGLIKSAAGYKLKQSLEAHAHNKDESETIWANAVLGEVALLRAEFSKAEAFFRRAATDPNVSVTQLRSLDDQLKMYQWLDYETPIVIKLRDIVSGQLGLLHKKCVGVSRGADDSRKVIVFRGKSFKGKELEQAVSAKIRRLLRQKEWKISKGDLVVCGARRGSEIIFAEQCVRLQADVRVLLPVKKAQFIAESVYLPQSNWEQRFNKLTKKCEVLEQHIRLGPPPPQLDPYERNNDWCLEIARTEYGPDANPQVLVLSVDDGSPHAKKDAILSHFVNSARELELPVKKIVVRGPGPAPSGRRLHIQLLGNKTSTKVFDQLLRIGRAKDNHVILDSPKISRYHIELVPHKEGARLKNLSRHPNTTLLDSEALSNRRTTPVLVKFGQTIELIDGTRIALEIDEEQTEVGIV